ncbi:Protein of unknown function [Pyronema omphalodes CBS 100304]|uniref:Uncharacterized protein n=1 Tax=Pyronema omphalodes (strain CBS 100304) TaxID=1076935 RepID=U4LA78_PYROM|nr:Protein of unknown function [Pyronema omphalodes CBS 100304]
MEEHTVTFNPVARTSRIGLKTYDDFAALR